VGIFSCVVFYAIEAWQCVCNTLFLYEACIDSMKNIRETCIEFFKSEDMKRDVKEAIKPIVSTIYNEIYVYLWLLCIYHVFFIFVVLANLFLLLKLLHNQSKTAFVVT